MAPSPKLQAQAVGALLEASGKVMVWPVVGALGTNENATTGAVTPAVTTTAWLTGLLEPPALVAVRVTV